MAELGLTNPPIFQPCSTSSIVGLEGYIKTFGNTDLIGGVLPIPHNLGRSPTLMTVLDEVGEKVFISKWVDIDINNSQLFLTGFEVTTNWKVRVL